MHIKVINKIVSTTFDILLFSLTISHTEKLLNVDSGLGSTTNLQHNLGQIASILKIFLLMFRMRLDH